jgi:deoxyribonuclease-4
MTAFDEIVGRDRLRAWHLNDSKKELGSRVDRHETIGEGHMGLEPFRHILGDPRSAELPMYLETPKGDRDERTLDAINLETLRSLIE